MRRLTPLFNAIKKTCFKSRTVKKPYQPICYVETAALYQAVFEKHGILITYEQASPTKDKKVPKKLHLSTILEKPEVQTQWFNIKKHYSTYQELDALFSDVMAIIEKKSGPKA